MLTARQEWVLQLCPVHTTQASFHTLFSVSMYFCNLIFPYLSFPVGIHSFTSSSPAGSYRHRHPAAKTWSPTQWNHHCEQTLFPHLVYIFAVMLLVICSKHKLLIILLKRATWLITRVEWTLKVFGNFSLYIYILYYIIFTFIFNILICNSHLYIETDKIFYYQTQMWDLVTWLCYLWQNGTSPLGIAKRLGYISVIDVLKLVTEESVSMVRAVNTIWSEFVISIFKAFYSIIFPLWLIWLSSLICATFAISVCSYIPSLSLRSPPRSIAWVSQRRWMKYWTCRKMKVRTGGSDWI